MQIHSPCSGYQLHSTAGSIALVVAQVIERLGIHFAAYDGISLI